jgi:hypothetical protein
MNPRTFSSPKFPLSNGFEGSQHACEQGDSYLPVRHYVVM